jgi:transcriptional regulator with GAF, ATPase, and Fis domain
VSEPGALTTVFVDDRATKRRLKRSKLVVSKGPDKGKELVIERERVTVGRSVICDLALEDKAVSGTHFEVVATEKGVLVRDLDSTNGTFCGDIRLREVWIKSGMVIRAGQSEIRFEPVQGSVEIDLSKDEKFHDLVGKSIRMREIFATLEKVGPSDLTVLIRGETGTGKELVARTLFGHEKGSFTGALDRHRGSFEQADAGTIFLDEIGELDIAMQPKLLRVLENREIKRVGGDRQIPVNVRVVAATNRDLRAMVNEGTFREDLFYRLSVVQIELPALRERPEDVPLLARSFLDHFVARRFPGEDKKFTVSKEAMARMQAFAWPGNVRELKNTIERAASLADELELSVRDLMPTSQRTPVAAMPGGSTAEQFVEENVPFKEAKQAVVDAFESAYLKSLLDKHGGNVTRSAQSAGLTRYHLRELAKRFGIRSTE